MWNGQILKCLSQWLVTYFSFFFLAHICRFKLLHRLANVLVFHVCYVAPPDSRKFLAFGMTLCWKDKTSNNSIWDRIETLLCSIELFSHIFTRWKASTNDCNNGTGRRLVTDETTWGWENTTKIDDFVAGHCQKCPVPDSAEAHSVSWLDVVG